MFAIRPSVLSGSRERSRRFGSHSLFGDLHAHLPAALRGVQGVEARAIDLRDSVLDRLGEAASMLELSVGIIQRRADRSGGDADALIQRLDPLRARDIQIAVLHGAGLEITGAGCCRQHARKSGEDAYDERVTKIGLDGGSIHDWSPKFGGSQLQNDVSEWPLVSS